MNTCCNCRGRWTLSSLMALAICVFAAWNLKGAEPALPDAEPQQESVALSSGLANGAWKRDPAWYQGKAEWALYDAVRPLYGKDRPYEATIFTNKQHMDTQTGVKAGQQGPGTLEVFKHNVSEVIPTDNYAYRFLTTSFVETSNLRPFRLTMSSQEDCGATYKRFQVDGDELDAMQVSYFPDEGEQTRQMRARSSVMYQDMLSLTLRDYPFDDPEHPDVLVKLIPDQTHTHLTSFDMEEARVRYVGRETLQVPFGSVACHHLVVDHEEDGGATASHYWFAADQGMRHVMVRYEGPYGVRYTLRRLDWWAYWQDERPSATR